MRSTANVSEMDGEFNYIFIINVRRAAGACWWDANLRTCMTCQRELLTQCR